MNSSEVEVLEPDPECCHVCGEKTGRHNYYGGQVCPSCRAFFRRAVQNKYYEVFTCLKNKRCKINLQTRKSCQFCRFQKCLKAGMKATWVLPDGDRKNKTANKNSKKLPLIPLPTLKFTSEDASFVELLINNFKTKNMSKIEQHQGFYAETLILTAFNKPFPFRMTQNFKMICKHGAQQKLISMPDFTTLSDHDQANLVISNEPMNHVFQEAFCLYDNDSGLGKMLEMNLNSRTLPAFEQAYDLLQKYNLENFKPVIKFENVYTSPWAPTLDQEVRYKEILEKIQNWLISSDGKLDSVLAVLGYCTLGLNTDFLALRNKKLVENLQVRYLNLMRSYLSMKHGPSEGRSKLADFMMIISLTREAAEISKQQLPF